MKKKSRKVKAVAKSKVFMSKKKLKGNIPLETLSDKDSDVDQDALFREDDYDEDDDLSTDDELIRQDEDSSEEEEVLAITDDEQEDWDVKKKNRKVEESEGGSESEDSEDDEERGLPNREGWGSKKSAYYSADFIDEDRGRTYREEDAEKARAEAEEAFAIQRSVSNVAANSTMAILQLQTIDEPSKVESEEEINLDSLDVKHKLKYLKKKCPELLLYINEFKEKMSELKDKIVPLLQLVNNGKTPSEVFSNYVKVKYQTLLHYCMNISFYMVLKSKGPVLSNHPVIQRISSFKNILDRLIGNENFNKEVDLIVEKLQRNEEVDFVRDEPTNVNEQKIQAQKESIFEKLQKISQMESTKGKKKSKSNQMDTEAEKEIFSLYMDLQKQKKENDLDSEDVKMDEDAIVDEGTVTEEKRTITYQIAKNKGLLPKRKKEHRNPRVHHRMKFRKAKIRRKGQVREVIREVKRYAGEPTGISSHVVKSIKMK